MSYRIGKSIMEIMKNVLYERKKYLRRQWELSAQIAVVPIAYSWEKLAGRQTCAVIPRLHQTSQARKQGR